MRRLLLLLLAATTLAGCGRKAPPLPPVLRVPQAVRDLAVEQTGTEAVLRFGYPQLTTAGGPLTDLESVEVWRLSLPPAQEPSGSGLRVEQLRRQLLEAQGERIAVLGPEELDAATHGPQLEVRDDLAAWYERYREELPLAVWYAVRVRCCGGRAGDFSNIVRLEPQLPPAPPTDLEAAVGAEGVQLRWTAVGGEGVLVERAPEEGEFVTLTTAPVLDGAYLDAAAGQGRIWRYRLRAVRTSAGGGRVVGAPGEELRVAYPDIYPPPAPQNLICLPEGERVRLRWDPVGAASVYRVFRQRGEEAWVHLERRLERTEFTDEAPPRGALTYAVRAVDEAGNESEAVQCSAAAQPR